jgi:energy-coupling factor transporter ATP-binding protein EcfA2
MSIINKESEVSAEDIYAALASLGYQGVSEKGVKTYKGGKLTKQDQEKLVKDAASVIFETLTIPWSMKSFEKMINRVTEALEEMELEVENAKANHGKILIYKSARRSYYADKESASKGGCTIVLYNTDKERVVNSHEYSIQTILSRLGLNRKMVEESPDIKYCETIFNPYIPDKIYPGVDDLGEPMDMINLYDPPEWRKLKAAPRYAGWIKKLFDHLFPVPYEREAVFDWIHYAMVSRCGTALVLAGHRGTGKSTAVSVIEAIIGSRNTEFVSEAVLTDKFNPQLETSRLIVFEEVAVENNKAVNKIKAWMNKKISVEQKGRDPFTTSAHFSMIFLLNKLEEFKVGPSERRFSIPSVASDSLLKIIPANEVAKISEGIKNEDPAIMAEVAEFGEWILHRKPTRTSEEPIKGEYFFTVTEIGIPLWANELIQHVKNNGEIGVEIPAGDIFADMEKRGISSVNRRDTIDNFLRDYRHKGTHTVASTRELTNQEFIDKYGARAKSRRRYVIIPNEDFLRTFGAKYVGSVLDEGSAGEDEL